MARIYKYIASTSYLDEFQIHVVDSPSSNGNTLI